MPFPTLRLSRHTLFASLLSLAAVNVCASPIGNLRKIEAQENAQHLSQIRLQTDHGEVLEISLLRADLFRVWAGSDGKLIGNGDKAAPIVIKTDYAKVDYQLSDQGDYQLIRTSKIALRLYKKPLRLALYKADNKSLVWQETQALELGEKSSFQTLSSSPDEVFFGGGQQRSFPPTTLPSLSFSAPAPRCLAALARLCAMFSRI